MRIKTPLSGARTRTDLPSNRKLAKDILILEAAFGEDRVFWDSNGEWLQINGFHLRSSRFEFSVNPIYILAFVPPGYGERRGNAAGIEEFYVPRDLKVRSGAGAWQSIPNTHRELDRREGKVVGMQHLYACVHIRDFDPRRHDVVTSLTALQLLLTDPEALR